MRSLVFLAALAALPVMAGAQSTRADQEKISESVPTHMLPPAGKCRIWMVGVAPEQQPAPTDCQTALRQRPTNGVVVFGPMERESGSSAFRGRPTPTPSIAPTRTETRGSSTETRGSSTETRGPSTESRAPSSETRPASRAQPPSGTRRPTEDPVKKPPAESPSPATSWEIAS